MMSQFNQIGQKVDFKNVQRRVYDALNVLSAMKIIQKDKYNIIYNHDNRYIPTDYPVSPIFCVEISDSLIPKTNRRRSPPKRRLIKCLPKNYQDFPNKMFLLNLTNFRREKSKSARSSSSSWSSSSKGSRSRSSSREISTF